MIGAVALLLLLLLGYLVALRESRMKRQWVFIISFVAVSAATLILQFFNVFGN